MMASARCLIFCLDLFCTREERTLRESVTKSLFIRGSSGLRQRDVPATRPRATFHKKKREAEARRGDRVGWGGFGFPSGHVDGHSLVRGRRDWEALAAAPGGTAATADRAG
jgi:hypothetical protein